VAISVGQLTIMDFNDAVSLTGFITSNKSKTVKYSADTGLYTPDFSTSSLVLTPSLFVAGSTTDLMTAGTNVQSVLWTKQTSADSAPVAISTGETMGASFPKALTVSTNILAGNVYSVEYICTIVYKDVKTDLNLTYKTSITISKVTDGNNVAIAEIVTDKGFSFKNGSPTSIIASAKLYRGATLDESLVSYVWQKLATGVWTAISGATSQSYTVTPAMVDSTQQFRCLITDIDSSSSTYNTVYTSEPIAFLDFNDTIQVVITSTGGTIFKNGEGTSTLKAVVYQNGVEVDANDTAYTYTWTVQDASGVARTFADASSTKTGKTISVGTSDVDVKSTFTCTIS
jgi:hypothetical protein